MNIDNHVYEFMRVAIMRFYFDCMDKYSLDYYSDLVKDFKLNELLKLLEDMYINYESRL